MIIVRLSDGLGNQMFQYATAKALAVQNNTDVIFDMSWYEINKHRGRRLYELDVFALSCPKINQVSKFGNFFLKNLHFTRNIYRYCARHRIMTMLNRNEGVFIKEKFLRYDTTVAQQAKEKNVYLQGYWQSENYFAGIREILLQDFQFRTALTGKNAETSQQIYNAPNPVALHIRRGDYLGTNYACCTLEYYQSAIRYLVGHLGEIQLFVFSNDIQWAMENLKTDQEMYFVGQNSEEKGYEDMRLMSLCHHHIIANSSFSWWGAWLSQYEEKIVIAPGQWLVKNTEEYCDIVPVDWIKIQVGCEV